MRKIKVFLVSTLLMLAMVFGLTSCGPLGKYKAAAFDPPLVEAIDLDTDDDSYIKFGIGKKVEVNIHIDLPIIDPIVIEDEGTWERGDEDGEFILKLDDGGKYTFTKEKGDIHLDLGVGVLILERA